MKAAVFDPATDILIGDLEREARRRRWPDGGRLFQVFMLAPTVHIAEAFLRGEAVPLDRLDSEWTVRFGRRAA